MYTTRNTWTSKTSQILGVGEPPWIGSWHLFTTFPPTGVKSVLPAFHEHCLYNNGTQLTSTTSCLCGTKATCQPLITMSRWRCHINMIKQNIFTFSWKHFWSIWKPFFTSMSAWSWFTAFVLILKVRKTNWSLIKAWVHHNKSICQTINPSP